MAVVDDAVGGRGEMRRRGYYYEKEMAGYDI